MVEKGAFASYVDLLPAAAIPTSAERAEGNEAGVGFIQNDRDGCSMTPWISKFLQKKKQEQQIQLRL